MIEAHHDDKNYQAKEDASAPVGLYRDADVEEDLVGCNNKNKETEKVYTNSDQSTQLRKEATFQYTTSTAGAPVPASAT